MEDLTPRQLLRIAETIRQRLIVHRDGRYLQVMGRLDRLAEDLSRVQAIRRQLGLAVGRCWYGAAEQTVAQIEPIMRDVPYFVGEVQEAAGRCISTPATVGDILAELRQLQDEFEQVRFDLVGQTLSAVTDPIELEDIYLGPFEIVLDLRRLGESRHDGVYHIVAIDPHPAGSNDSVTHPHVSGEHLCEGDAGAAIGAALANGRIADFFIVARSVLTTYNPNSPYVSLGDWFGQPCHDCGDTIGSDDACFCTKCESDFCENCISYCRRCDESVCFSCLQECPICEERMCSSCMTTCPGCGAHICQNCKEEAACPCQEEKTEHEHEQQAEPCAGAAGQSK
jgi:hypothetical protein